MVKNQPVNAGDTRDAGMQVQSLGREDLLERKWQLSPVFLPGKSHGQRSLVDYSPWGHKEWDTAACGHAHMLLSPNIGQMVALFCLGLGDKDPSGTMLVWGGDRCLYHVTGVSTYLFHQNFIKTFFSISSLNFK